MECAWGEVWRPGWVEFPVWWMVETGGERRPCRSILKVVSVPDP